MDSFCKKPRTCYGYEHRHCTVCGDILDAQGDGPVYAFDRPTIAGYANERGDAKPCSECGDDFFLVCAVCAKTDTRCADCRNAVPA